MLVVYVAIFSLLLTLVIRQTFILSRFNYFFQVVTNTQFIDKLNNKICGNFKVGIMYALMLGIFIFIQLNKYFLNTTLICH